MAAYNALAPHHVRNVLVMLDELNGASEIWLAVPGNDMSANIEQNDQRETRQKKSRLVSIAEFQSEQDASDSAA